jgi:hypothetical protein
MSADGPSKEELEYYFKNSRQYFDELAKHFYETDRDYYNKFIAPFYSPFGRMTPGSKPRSKAAYSLVVAGLLGLLAAGFAVFLIFQSTDNTSIEPGKKTESPKENTRSKPDEKVKPPDTQTQSNKISNYEKGLKFYNQKDYDAAERYFNKVTKDDDNYEDAQNKLEEINKLRDENTSGNREKRDRHVKPRPVEKIR